jgi:Mg-chelatase subunit ChlD
VLVIDVSSSMLRSAGDGGSKLDAVMRAARAFIDRFDPERSQGRVAIVVFNERAWMTQPMTGDRELLDAAIDDLPNHIREGTRLDLGLLAGAEALGEAEPGRWRAMVFLTDGLPNRVPTPAPDGRQEDTVLAAAAEVRGRGVEIHAVGYGRVDAQDIADRISPELLREIAGDDARYHETDDAGGLAEVFRGIASLIGCGRDVGWP